MPQQDDFWLSTLDPRLNCHKAALLTYTISQTVPVFLSHSHAIQLVRPLVATERFSTEQLYVKREASQRAVAAAERVVLETDFSADFAN